jgi:hypothetical protein
MNRCISTEVESFRQFGHGVETAELAVVPGRQLVDDDIGLRIKKCEKGTEVVAERVEIQVGHWRNVLAKTGREGTGIIRQRKVALEHIMNKIATHCRLTPTSDCANFRLAGIRFRAPAHKLRIPNGCEGVHAQNL